MNDETNIHQLTYADDLLDYLARLLLDRQRQQPVDLSHNVVLFPDIATRQRFRQKLLEVAEEQAVHALIPPNISSLQSWLEQFRPDDTRTLNHNEQELFLLQALANFPRYLERYGTWPLIDSLLALFQELTLNEINIQIDEEEFRRSIETAYGVRNLAPLNDEAKLVHTLWQAWVTDLKQQNRMDYAMAHVAALANCASTLPTDVHLYVAGFQHFSAAEQHWIDALESRGQIDVLAYRTKISHDKLNDYGRFLDTVFSSSDESLLVRSEEQEKRAQASPIANKVEVLEARNLEQEARGIDIQVRRWLLQGKKNIGIVCNNRRLARRVRALQERADIDLIDGAGWPLSTTSAASVIMRWLDCVESHFQFQSLFDFLQSPFMAPTINRGRYQDLIAHFEEFVVYRVGITSDLLQYIETIEHNKNLFDERAGINSGSEIVDLLNKLKAAAEPSRQLTTGIEAPAEVFFKALQSSLSQLAVSQTLQNDDAGIEVIENIDSLVRCVTGIPHHVDWNTFRTWLARSFERAKFKPVMTGGGVELMGFSESRLYQFDALIIGSATREHLPGSAPGSPFFNESVRTQLNLPSGLQAQRDRALDFQHLLYAAPNILITCSAEDNGAPLAKSPWLQQLQSFHLHTYGSSLCSNELMQMTETTETLLTSDNNELPPPERPPTVKVAADLLPPVFSASSYQQLIDCPFRFFSGSNLGLRQRAEIGEELEKKDYGTRVHRILQAFHSDISGLPGPFKKLLTDNTIDEATALLSEITKEVFKHDIRKQPSAQGWLNLWQRIIPRYLAWQQQREQHWVVKETEQTASRSLGTEPNMEMGGRIDRIDVADGKISLIDYKTGKAPKKKNITGGESVQLLFYALLTEKPPAEIMALELGDDGVTSTALLKGDVLQGLLDEEMMRLQLVTSALIKGTEMPAWGDPKTCDYCEFEGICRKEHWAEKI
ncbi:MAG: PD-(D/E)XK nuclease family protein [Acidiferrobacterales bacterium]